MKVYLGADHAGFELKEKVKSFLQNSGYETEDLGAFEYKQDDDYPDLIVPVAQKVASEEGIFGIVFGKSGAGEAIVANKIKNIRAVLGVDEDNIKLAREHNDANILSLGAAFITPDYANELVKLFLTTPFSNEENHVRRIGKIKKLES